MSKRKPMKERELRMGEYYEEPMSYGRKPGKKAKKGQLLIGGG